MLAYMDDERLDGIIEEHGLPSVTENTITDEDELRAELGAIRERGYATDDEERLEGIRCVAAPVRTSGDEVVGAVSVSGIKSRMQGEHFRERVPRRCSAPSTSSKSTCDTSSPTAAWTGTSRRSRRRTRAACGLDAGPLLEDRRGRVRRGPVVRLTQ
ncbi:IclR family transcriptional regulator [Halosimplex aquaticum]